MSRLELYHNKTKPFSWKGLFLIPFAGVILTVGFFVFRYYDQSSIKIEAPAENLGEKVVVDLPNGQKVYTYENLIIEKDGKLYYQGERNTIDLTGGTISYKQWE